MEMEVKGNEVKYWWKGTKIKRKKDEEGRKRKKKK